MTRLYDPLGFLLPCAACGTLTATWTVAETPSGARRYRCTRCGADCSAANAVSTHEVLAGRWPVQEDPWTPPPVDAAGDY